jgi:protein kinase A
MSQFLNKILEGSKSKSKSDLNKSSSTTKLNSHSNDQLAGGGHDHKGNSVDINAKKITQDLEGLFRNTSITNHQQQQLQFQQQQIQYTFKQPGQKPKFALQEFNILRTLGTGSFGRVHLVQKKDTSQYLAMKVMKKSEVVRLKQVEHTLNEKKILDIVDFPFLVNMLGSFQDSQNLYFIMEYVQGGELFSLLRRSQRFSNSVGRFYAAQVVMAFEYLHSKDIVYRGTF